MTEAGIHPRRDEVITVGVKISKRNPRGAEVATEFRGRHDLGNSAVILSVGNITERKGQHVVVRALPTVLSAAPDARYVMVGLPTDREAVEGLARELGVADAIRIVGVLDTEDLAAAYEAADVFAMTSCEASDGQVEGFGIAVLEAALCEVPAVVSGGSGLDEAVADGRTGIVVPQRDADETARALATLLESPEQARRMGARARAKVLREHDQADISRRYEALLQSLVTETSGDARSRGGR